MQVQRLNGGRPLLAPRANWWENGVTFNPAAVLVQDPAVVRALLPMFDPGDARLAEGVAAVHYRARPEVDPGSAFTRSFIGLALFTPDLRPLYRCREPVLYPSPDPAGYDALGVEDPRITWLDGRYYMVYCGVRADAQAGCRVALCLAVSDDLLRWQKLGPLAGELNAVNNKDGALFPERINGHYYLLHRPQLAGRGQGELAIQLARSDSPLGPWQDCGELMRAFTNPRMRVSWLGAGTVPLACGPGRYAMIYHTGNYLDEERREYDLDAALLDFNGWDGQDPRDLVRGRLEHWMVPQSAAELRSRSRLQVANVLFACGAYRFREDLYVVYGGADTYTLAARANWQELITALEASGLANPFCPG